MCTTTSSMRTCNTYSWMRLRTATASMALSSAQAKQDAPRDLLAWHLSRMSGSVCRLTPSSLRASSSERLRTATIWVRGFPSPRWILTTCEAGGGGDQTMGRAREKKETTPAPALWHGGWGNTRGGPNFRSVEFW